ncbi:hypothetical protein Tco_0066726 [Tanacetum coccineum]
MASSKKKSNATNTVKALLDPELHIMSIVLDPVDSRYGGANKNWMRSSGTPAPRKKHPEAVKRSFGISRSINMVFGIRKTTRQGTNCIRTPDHAGLSGTSQKYYLALATVPCDKLVIPGHQEANQQRPSRLQRQNTTRCLVVLPKSYGFCLNYQLCFAYNRIPSTVTQSPSLLLQQRTALQV